jgi:activator of HSP90 ATPase
MPSKSVSRREVSARLLGLLPALSLAASARADAETVPFSDDSGVSRNCECIHQEVVMQASRARVYKALTDAKEFSKVTEFSMPGAGAAISPDAGGEFSLFTGIISGRNIEMVPGVRLVQAWRAKDMGPGIYTIARFQLKDEGPSTRLIFDQTAIPQGMAEHLAEGWKSHYWEPLQKYLAKT